MAVQGVNGVEIVAGDSAEIVEAIRIVEAVKVESQITIKTPATKIVDNLTEMAAVKILLVDQNVTMMVKMTAVKDKRNNLNHVTLKITKIGDK